MPDMRTAPILSLAMRFVAIPPPPVVGFLAHGPRLLLGSFWADSLVRRNAATIFLGLGGMEETARET